MSAREELLCQARKVLWDAWAQSSEEIGSEAARTLMGLGMLVPQGGAVELERLRLLMNAQPVELTEAQRDALSDAGNRALNDHYHEDLCFCRDWPESCATAGYFPGMWDTGAFDIGLGAVLGLWESMRTVAPQSTEVEVQSRELSTALAELERLRARMTELEALKPAPIQTCQTCGAGYTYGQPCSTCQFKARMAAEQGRQAEDPHDSPLHSAYATCRDLPEVPRA